MAPSSPSPDRNSIPDAASLVIAVKEESYDDFAASNTPGLQQNMAGHEPFWNRDRSGSSSGSTAGASMLHRWQSATARGELPVSEVLQQPSGK